MGVSGVQVACSRSNANPGITLTRPVLVSESVSQCVCVCVCVCVIE